MRCDDGWPTLHRHLVRTSHIKQCALPPLQALRLLCPGAEVAGLLRLNLSRPGIELLVAQAKGPVK